MNARARAIALGAVLLSAGASFGAAAEPGVAPVAPQAADQPAAAAPGPGAPELVARVNGVGITKADFTRNWEFLQQRRGVPSEQSAVVGADEQLQRDVLERLVDEELLYQEAKRRNHAPPPAEVEAQLQQAHEQFPTPEAFAQALAGNGLTEEGLRALFARNQSIERLVEKEIIGGLAVSDADVHDFYAGNRETFALPEEVHARHILVKVDAGADEQTRKAALAEAEGLLAQLKAGADFAALARQHSDCPTAAEGGDLGFLRAGQTVPAFDQAAFALAPGALSGVVTTEFGYHIIKSEGRKAAAVIPEAQVAPKIRDYLLSRKQEAAVAEHVKALRATARVELLMEF